MPSAGKNFIRKSRLLRAAGLPDNLPFLFRNKSIRASIRTRIKYLIRRLKYTRNNRKDVENSNILLAAALDKTLKEMGDSDNKYDGNDISGRTDLTEVQKRQIVDRKKDVKEVLNLNFLLQEVMSVLQPLDWDTFVANDQYQPLRIVATNVRNMTPVALSRSNGNYHDLPSMLACIRASMLVPGAAGNLMSITANSPVPVEIDPAAIDIHRKSKDVKGKKNSDDSHSQASPVRVSASESLPYVTATDFGDSEYLNLTEFKSRVVSNEKSANTIFREMAINKESSVITEKTLGKRRSSKFLNIFQWWKRRPTINSTENYSLEEEAIIEVLGKAGDVENVEAVAKETDGTYAELIDYLDSKILQTEVEATIADLEDNADAVSTDEISTTIKDSDKFDSINSYIPLADAFLCEPIPYRSAVAEGATHVINLRTRPNPCTLLGKGPGIFENLIGRRYFNKYGESNAVDWLQSLGHQQTYAEDGNSLSFLCSTAILSSFLISLTLVLRMNACLNGSSVSVDGNDVFLLPIAPHSSAAEVSQLEIKKEKIFMGMRDGARAALRLFLPAILQRANQDVVTEKDIFRMGKDTTEDFTAEEIDKLIEDAVETIFPMTIMDRNYKLEDFYNMKILQAGLTMD